MSINATADLWQAVGNLINQRPVQIQRDNGTTETTFIDSLLDQAISMLKPSGEMSSGGSGGGKPESRPPLSLDAMSIVHEIERYTEAPDLAHGIRAIAATLDRTHDYQGQIRFTGLVGNWIARIEALTGVQQIKTRPLSIHCPACQSLWIWDFRDDEAIRTYAVFASFNVGSGELVSFGCLVCKNEWNRGGDLDALVDWQLAQ